MMPTDELRRLLDERGVEYEVDDAKTVRVTRWRAYGDWVSFIEYDNGDTKFCIDARRLTPEQAIAATQGAGTCRVIATKKLGDSFGYRLSCGHSMVNPFDDHPDYCPWCGRKVVGE